MKRFLTLALLALVLAPLPCTAQWGWPPPGYSTSSFVAPDGSHYRRLCQVLRDRRQRKKGGGASVSAAPCAASVIEAPASGLLPPVLPADPQR